MYIVENPNKVCPMNMNEYIYFQSIVPGSNPYENSCFGNNGRSNHILNFKLQYIKHFHDKNENRITIKQYHQAKFIFPSRYFYTHYLERKNNTVIQYHKTICHH